MISPELLNLFPHDSMRKGQIDLVSDLDESFTEGKILLAHAPTGLGKTAAALTVALHHANKHDKIVFFLTNRHTQHKIAVDTLQQIRSKTGLPLSCVDLIGKRWMCNQEIKNLYGNEFSEFCKAIVEKGECQYYAKVRTKSGLTVEAQAYLSELQQEGPLHNEQLIARGHSKGMCSYELAIAMGKNAKVIIGDYYYLFNSFIYLMRIFKTFILSY